MAKLYEITLPLVVLIAASNASFLLARDPFPHQLNPSVIGGGIVHPGRPKLAAKVTKPLFSLPPLKVYMSAGRGKVPNTRKTIDTYNGKGWPIPPTDPANYDAVTAPESVIAKKTAAAKITDQTTPCEETLDIHGQEVAGLDERDVYNEKYSDKGPYGPPAANPIKHAAIERNGGAKHQRLGFLVTQQTIKAHATNETSGKATVDAAANIEFKASTSEEPTNKSSADGSESADEGPRSVNRAYHYAPVQSWAVAKSSLSFHGVLITTLCLLVSST